MTKSRKRFYHKICGILMLMPDPTPAEFSNLYARFDAPITTLDCGKKCAPYHEYGIPFCCDTSHSIPTSYLVEWDYLQSNTDLWHEWEHDDPEKVARLWSDTPDGQILIECLGHRQCQRGYRSITCRAFPFFPYITNENDFIGLSYYWEYEDRCWVISHLDAVTPEYTQQFVKAFDWIFEMYPDELSNFRYQSIIMRRVFGRQKRGIPLLHRDGNTFNITPKDGKLNDIDLSVLRKHGPYEVAALMPFPDEVKNGD